MASFPLIMQAWDEKHWSKPELIEQPELMQVKLVLRLDMNVPDQVLYKYPTSTDETIKLIKVIGDKVGSIKEIMLLIDLKDREHFMDKYLTPPLKVDMCNLSTQTHLTTQSRNTCLPKKEKRHLTRLIEEQGQQYLVNKTYRDNVPVHLTLSRTYEY